MIEAAERQAIPFGVDLERIECVPDGVEV